MNAKIKNLLFWEWPLHNGEDQSPKQGLNAQIQRLIVVAWNFDSTVFKTPSMLTLQDFRVMPFEKKCDVITFYGNYIAQRSLADCKVFLYFTEGFFIEVFYSPKYKKVLMINAFEKPIGLDPYLDKISLADLAVA